MRRAVSPRPSTLPLSDATGTPALAVGTFDRSLKMSLAASTPFGMDACGTVWPAFLAAALAARRVLTWLDMAAACVGSVMAVTSCVLFMLL